MRWLAFILICVAVAIGHPYVDQGSDSDDALEIGAQSLILGQNPYQCSTQLGNPLTPMLGWLVLCLPSAFIGSHVWTIFWMVLAIRKWPTGVLVVLFLLSGKTLIQGIDYAANACVVLWLCSLLSTGIPVGDAAASSMEPVRSDRGDYSDVSEWDLLVDWMGGASDKPEVCGSDRGDYAVRCLCAGVLLLLPAIWVSNAAYHTILALPFILNSRI